jgi:hypothetical protein
MRDAAGAAKAVQMLDLLTEFFEDGQRWIRGDFHDDLGNRCLVGAMRHIRAVHHLYGDPTRYYLQKAMPLRELGLMGFNDSRKEFQELLNLIAPARDLALADVRKDQPLSMAA